MEQQTRRGLSAFVEVSKAWDQLAGESANPNFFLRSDWLSATAKHLCEDHQLHTSCVYLDNKLVAAGFFKVESGVASFVGESYADYCDIPVSNTLDEETAAKAIQRVLEGLEATCNTKLRIQLNRIPTASTALSLFRSNLTRYRCIDKYSVPAPFMSAEQFEDNLRKKSMRRLENKLRRAGELKLETHHTPAQLLQNLERFYELHIARWDGTDTPSVFNDPKVRQFYNDTLCDIAGRAEGCVRLTCLSLNDNVIAAHLGFLYGGRYMYYKPAFDQTLSEFSPGKVLLKATIEDADNNDAATFDFGIGDESYKFRFTDRIQHAHDIVLTRSAVSRVVEEARSIAKRILGRGHAQEAIAKLLNPKPAA